MPLIVIDDNRLKLTEEGTFRHPEFNEKFTDWQKFRLTYDGGRVFIQEYLKKFGKREDTTAFNDRKNMTYSPSFAKASLNEIINAIYPRITDVTRQDGTTSYQEAVLRDVDRKGSSMSSFIGQEVLAELLSIGKVGVFCDMPILSGQTVRDQQDAHPYLYAYQAEDIFNWSVNREGGNLIFTNLLLRDHHEHVDPVKI